MVYYCDYEALEFNNKEAIKNNIYPYYLNSNLTESSLCPLFFSASNNKGKIITTQNVFKMNISFLKFLDNEIRKYKRVERKIMQVWFHNIKYDFRIILYELFHNKFINVVDSEDITYIGDYKEVEENIKCFSIIGKNLSSFIGINLYYKGFKILIRDTMSILNTAQDNILKNFGYDSKVVVEWEKININNLKEYMNVIEERNIYDVTSLALALEEFKNTIYDKFHGRGSTASGIALDALKHYLCINIGLEESEINHDTKNEIFRNMFPMLLGINKDISKGCYHGGICTLNKNHCGKTIRNLQMIDINSSYPYSMTFPLPYGEGTEINDFSTSGYSEYIVYIKFKHKGIPFQRCHSENRAREVLNLEPKEVIYTRSQFPKKFEGYICINSIDLELLTKYANVTKLEFKKGIRYETTTIIRDFIIPLYNERKISKGIIKEAIKLILNSLYGKYAQDLSGVIFQYLDVEEYNNVLAIDNNTLYKPFASAVTAYSRQNLVNTIYLIGDNFVYCDTDSIYFKNIEESIPIFEKNNIIHDNELGKWAFEYKAIHKAKFLGKKNYIIDCTYYDKEEGKEIRKNKLTCVGLSHKYHSQVNFNNFVINSKPFEIYKMVNVYGGKAMRKTSFEIKERNF